ncbi:MAG: 50S ribosomal protein L25/general stress protein Ctc [Gammaproteobacteria bacterium]|jgi:large subunit ribosomal protein L25|nr:50S ribosomal protein L25/general stress protein Ctc [Gammaproteobacteria bacterium]MBT5541334.1 50S ribosomal protein L25/general stress protein Ctc [Gammaproteobacteria bacterium]MBT7753524.1 50S ribosomal protein L25/general stress protein Ctc [Gammaproteobacteria bacterium]MDG2435447.1 50S ribosomal protein L25/general stress protein Ctc [Gammaproteobacteria bacterium]
MSNEFNLIAELREQGEGTSSSRRLRRSGLVPGVIYGAGKDTIKLSIDHNQLLRKLNIDNFLSSIISININDKKEDVLIKDIQVHPSKQQVMHLDFLRIKSDEVIRVKVPVIFLNEDSATGVKLEGGTVTPLMNEIEVSCLPRDLPEHLEIDIIDMKVDDMLYLEDIVLPSGVEITLLTQEEPSNEPVVAVRVLRIAEEVVEEVELGEGEEGAEETDSDGDEETTEEESESNSD